MSKERIEIKISAKLITDDERNSIMFKDTREFQIDATRNEATQLMENMESIIEDKFGDTF